MSPPDEEDRVNAALAYGFMADVAVVEVDKRTFVPRLVEYYAVHDLGRTLEPEIVRGQLVGGVLHGMGGALFEELAYDRFGQPRAVSFVDYLSPTAAEAPRVELEHLDVPSPSNPLGVKGGGESSAMSAPAAIAAAVEDALGHAGIHIDRLPVEPAALWAALAQQA
jgi:2-furoyl-CoA dehydrogenase large subunit